MYFTTTSKMKKKVAKCISTLSSMEDHNRFQAGSMALLKAEQKLLERKIVTIYNSFKECVKLPALNLSSADVEMVTDDEQDSLYSWFEESNDSSSSQSEDEI